MNIRIPLYEIVVFLLCFITYSNVNNKKVGKRGVDMKISEEGQKEWDDRVRRDKSDKNYNELVEYHNDNIVDPRNKFVDNNPEYAREHGIKRLDRLKTRDCNWLEHAENEATASLYNSMRFSDEDAKKMVAGASKLLEKMEKRERDAWEERDRNEKEREKRREKYGLKVRVFSIISMVLGGIFGGWAFFSFFPDIYRHWWITALGCLVADGLMIGLGELCGDKWRGSKEIWGCGGCFVGLGVIFVFCSLPIIVSSVATGVFLGTFIGFVVSGSIGDWILKS
jgi:hypothetical protein